MKLIDWILPVETNIAPVEQHNMKKEIFRKQCRVGPRLTSLILCFRLVIFFHCHTFGEGIDFCFDGSKEGEF